MYILLDIGGTSTRIGVSKDGQAIDDIKKIPTSTNFEEGMANIKSIAMDFTKNAPITAIGIACAGPLDKAKTKILNAPNLKDYSQKPLKETLETTLNAPAHLDNDAALAGLGEATHGAGKNHNIIAYLTISTGIGGARITNKKIDTSASGFEPGHQIVQADGLLCGCGVKGHLEGYASGSGLYAQHNMHAEEITDPAIWSTTAKWIAIGLNNTIMHWSPNIVILGGSLMKTLSTQEITSQLEALSPIITPPPIEKAQLGDASGLYGALTVCRS